MASSDERSAPSATREADAAAPLSSPGSDGAPSVPNRGVTAVEVGAASFPASDPPASWTWDVPQSTPRS
jgi:hypothetical protein